MEGILGDVVTGYARDTATGDPMGDDSGIRNRGNVVTCVQGSPGPNIIGFRVRLQRMGFGFVVFGSSVSFGLGFAFGMDTGKAGVESETVVAAVSVTLRIHARITGTCEGQRGRSAQGGRTQKHR